MFVDCKVFLSVCLSASLPSLAHILKNTHIHTHTHAHIKGDNNYIFFSPFLKELAMLMSALFIKVHSIHFQHHRGFIDSKTQPC